MKYKIKTHSQLALITDIESGDDINLSQIEDRLNAANTAITVIKSAFKGKRTKAQIQNFIELAIKRMEQSMVIVEPVVETGFITDYDSVKVERPDFWLATFPVDSVEELEHVAS